MVAILTWISIVAGGILVLLLLLSIFSGLDFDLDVGGDTDVDSGGLGLIKGILTFISVGSWVIKIVMMTNQHPGVAIAIGIISGLVAVWLLSQLLKLLLKNEQNVNWNPEDALFQEAKVYLKVSAKEGSGIVHVNINGATRELKAKTNDKKDIPTGSTVFINDYINGFAIVTIHKN